MCNCPKEVKEYLHKKNNNLKDNKLFLLAILKTIENLDKLDILTLRLEIFQLLKDNPELLNIIYWQRDLIKNYYKKLLFKTKLFTIKKSLDIKQEIKKWNTNFNHIQ